MTNQAKTQALFNQTQTYAKHLHGKMDKIGDNTHEKAAFIYTSQAADELRVAANAITEETRIEFVRRAIMRFNSAMRYLPDATVAKHLRKEAKQLIGEDIEQPDPPKASKRDIEKASAKSLGF